MVQSFLVEESKELIFDTDKLEEWKQKCEELGLSGQLELTAPEKSPLPFEFMDTVTKRVYETLCPSKVNFKEYKKTAIPLEVLSLIHLSVNEKYFDEIQIWYDDKSPDPLAVGINKHGEYGATDNYTIARWGDVLKPFAELKELAIARYTNSSTLTLKGKIADLTNRLENVQLNSQRYFDAQAEYYDVTGF
jgi:hypothetical protein